MDQEKKLDEFVDRDEEKWVYDSSVDYKGRVPLRASTGAWKASLFIIATEFSERLSYFGLAANMIMYLTKVLHQDLKTAAKSVNCWSGVTTIMPLLGGFLADAYLGRFSTVVASSLIYIMGLLLLTMSRVVPGLKPGDEGSFSGPGRAHEVVFFLAIYMISIGTGGHKPSLESFGADQFDDDHPLEKKKKMSFFNWWCFGLCCGLLLGVTVIVYIQDHVGWATADIILTAVMASTTAIIWIGRPLYRYRKPMGSPLTPLLQVVVAAFTKRNLPYPSEPDQLYEVPKSTDKNQPGTRFLLHTKKLRFLDKAAIIEDVHDSRKQNPWRLATVTKVEELKLILNMIPIWMTTLPFGICVAQSSTFFVKQSTNLNRNIAHGFMIPPATVYGFAAISLIVSISAYDKILVPFLRRITGNDRGIDILQRIGIGMTFSIATMIVAALVERKRLAIVGGDRKNSLSMSVFWLAPQYVIIAVGDCFTLVGLQEYFYDQVPDSMRSLGIALYLSVLGASSFLSSILITVVDRVTEKGGRSWFGEDLNSSRLDYFYWLLAGITAGNLLIYSFVARRYSYKNVRKPTVAVADCYVQGSHGAMP
ncbi:Major facilitator superfamily protein [Perilla frutescens var. hirtella]|uniref:Major facilitator superfamily protein n=1 Tax=Perilla frutescens var. hirtella TaxID=608512 RepID=A0AAD4P3Q2_PERFH|nr:Major facilitator superfamily protein [Perilla frutescens var. hirtella]